MKILIIEDNEIIIETIAIALHMRWPDAQIISTVSGVKGVSMAETESPNLIILDLGLPDITGYEVLKQVRLFSNVSIIILTVRSDESAIVKSLEGGADDYLLKPFKPLELLARIRALMRRSNIHDEESLVVGELRFKLDTLELYLDEKPIKVSRTEGLILAQLMRQAGLALSTSKIAENIWGENRLDSDSRIKVHIRHLREKLEADPSNPQFIITVPAVGYSLVKPI